MAAISLAGMVKILGAVVTLVFLEGLLSADNALVLAVMVRHLPKIEQKRALRYGIFGAFFFRLVAILFASTLLEYWWFKVVGGVYLLYLAVSNLVFGEADDATECGSAKRIGKGFWATVIGVELADIAFSIDSILAAVAMADGLPREIGDIFLFRLPLANVVVNMKMLIIYIGGVLGILAMRFVAGYFLILLEKFAGLAIGAYYLVGWIGLKLVGSGFEHALHPSMGKPPAEWVERLPGWIHRFPFEMAEWFFWTGMGLILLLSLLVGRTRKREEDSTQPESPSELEVAERATAEALLGEEQEG